MVDFYTKEEKVAIVIDIIKKLVNFPSKNGDTVNLYNSNYLYVERFKKITNDWINNEKSYEGTILFEELNKYFEYNFPEKKNKEPLFVLRMNK